jgi:UDP-N-acetylglucosamine--N-acetylmuramyl-(pentapeptide) pyrophosphoryl-undecaprenol N-acetylglucosamine transferase
MGKIITVVFAGGGTGGHIYPGLAVADALREQAASEGRDIRIYWIGCVSGMDRIIVEKNVDRNGKRSADFFYGIPAGKLRRYFSLKNITDIFKIAGGFFASFVLLAKIKPAVLFSKGGFVSVPPCAAAKLLHIPVYTHECDFTPGLATKLNSRNARRILVTYKETIVYLKSDYREKAVVTGNPVRSVFYSASADRGRAFLEIKKEFLTKPVLVVIGGSSGARQINELIKKNLSWLTDHFFVVHQTGSKNAEDTVSTAAGYQPYPFIYTEMPDVLAAADIILSRAGANSIWECTVLAKPLILVPLCGSGTRGDQEANAQYFAGHGAALVLDRSDADSDHLKAALIKFAEPEVRARYAAACGLLAEGEHPAEKIASLLYNEVKGGKE